MMSEDRILSLYSSTWVTWMILGLLIILFLLLSVRPEYIKYGFKSFFSLLERQYVAAGSMLTVVGMTVFCVMSTSLACSLMIYNGGAFFFKDVLYISLSVIVCMTVKRLLTYFAGYVFSFEKEVKVWQEQKLCMWLVLSVVMLAVSALASFMPMTGFAFTCFVLTAAVYVAAVLIKMFRIFIGFSSFSILYILIYVLTLEVLPLVTVVVAAERIV